VTDGQAQLATALTMAGRAAEALPYFEHALAQRPDDAQLHNDYGVALEASGQLEPAILQFHEALRLQPALPDAQTNLDFARNVLRNDASTARHMGEPR
jgi:Flp pilus assembly protein TadD